MGSARLLLILCGGLSISACADYTAVGKLSTRMTEATGAWKGVAEQSKLSCRRLVELGDGTEECTTKDRAADALIAVNDRLSRYFAALGGVAEDKNYSVSDGMSDLSGEIANIPGINTDDGSAISELTTTIANLLLQGRRERTMRRLIDDGAPPAQRVIAMMRRVGVPTFGGNLLSERQRIDLALATTVPRPLERLGPDRSKWCMTPPRLYAFDADRPAFLMATELCRRHREVREDLAAVAAYDASLAAAAKALEELQSSATRLKASDTAARLYDRAHDLRKKIDAVRARRAAGDEA